MRHAAVLAAALLLAAQASAMGNYNCRPPAAVPEPAAIGLFAAGSAVVGWALSRRK